MDYNYAKNINSPSDMGMSANGTIQTLGNDIQGLIAYTELLVTGQGKASKTGRPLGSKYFFNTHTQCTDPSTKQNIDRYIYINNVPSGNIPFIQGDYQTFEGLIPGVLGNMANMSLTNPLTVFQSFQKNGGLACQQITMQTIDGNNNQSTETQYVATLDIQNMDPCWFQNSRNPITGQSCVNEGFRQRHQTMLIDTYFALFGCLLIYIFAGVLMKQKLLFPSS
jgi:hypothetical protein